MTEVQNVAAHEDDDIDDLHDQPSDVPAGSFRLYWTTVRPRFEAVP